MSNLTISVDDDLIKRARVRAIQQGTSLSAKVREFLAQYVNTPENDGQKQREADAQRLLTAIDRATLLAQSSDTATLEAAAPKPRTLRDEIYEGNFRDRDRATSS